jgi:hypothetical protein
MQSSSVFIPVVPKLTLVCIRPRDDGDFGNSALRGAPLWPLGDKGAIDGEKPFQALIRDVVELLLWEVSEALTSVGGV